MGNTYDISVTADTKCTSSASASFCSYSNSTKLYLTTFGIQKFIRVCALLGSTCYPGQQRALLFNSTHLGSFLYNFYNHTKLLRPLHCISSNTAINTHHLLEHYRYPHTLNKYSLYINMSVAMISNNRVSLGIMSNNKQNDGYAASYNVASEHVNRTIETGERGSVPYVNEEDDYSSCSSYSSASWDSNWDPSIDGDNDSSFASNGSHNHEDYVDIGSPNFSPMVSNNVSVGIGIRSPDYLQQQQDVEMMTSFQRILSKADDKRNNLAEKLDGTSEVKEVDTSDDEDVNIQDEYLLQCNKQWRKNYGDIDEPITGTRHRRNHDESNSQKKGKGTYFKIASLSLPFSRDHHVKSPKTVRFAPRFSEDSQNDDLFGPTINTSVLIVDEDENIYHDDDENRHGKEKEDCVCQVAGCAIM